MENLQITTNLRYDNDLSTIYFNENFEILQYSDYRQNSILLFTSGNELSNSYSIDEDIEIIENKQNRLNCLKLLVNEEYLNYSECKDSVYDAMIDYIINDYDFKSLDDLIELLYNYGIEYKRNYVTISSRGCSQWDYAEILFNIKNYKLKNGKEFNEADYQEYFNNLLWNAPINGNIEISFDYGVKRDNFNDTLNQSYKLDIYYDEFCNNTYKVDLDINTIMNIITKETFNNLSTNDYLAIEKEVSNISYEDVQY